MEPIKFCLNLDCRKFRPKNHFITLTTGLVQVYQLLNIFNFLNSAESFTSSGDSTTPSGPSSPTGSGSSRRDRFNFIAEVVEETAPALVYIQVGSGA